MPQSPSRSSARSVAGRTVRPTPTHLRQAYLSTELWIDVDGEWLGESGAVSRLTAPIYVLTASNPGSELQSDDANDVANESLCRDLTELGVEVHDAIGESPTGDWFETSFAVSRIGRRRARALGREYGQEAVFELKPEGLAVLGCFTAWTRTRQLDHGTAWSAERSADGLTLVEAVESELGIEAVAEFIRAGFAGWEPEGATGLDCGLCGGELFLFGNDLEARDGTLYRAMAVVCTDEGVARLPHEHLRELPALKAWRTYDLLRQDADDAGRFEATYNVYVIELDDDVGPREDEKEWVYVGESALPPGERLERHLAGVKASKWVRDHGEALRPDLVVSAPPLRTREESRAYEAYLAERLRLEGYSVKGGH